jgi:CDP-paratose 2-epimerase
VRILITGVCGFVGSTLVRDLRRHRDGLELWGLDNFSRPGSQINRDPLVALGVRVLTGDVRNPRDFDAIPAVDWVIDAAANPTVVAGVDGRTSAREVLDHNLTGTIETLEFCRRVQAGVILLSTSRVYSTAALSALPLMVADGAFRLSETLPAVGARGVAETCSTEPPLSFYGSSKRCSEILALEYGQAFHFPVRINRCGVLAGAGQFGQLFQGIFTFWINAYLRRRPLRYCGFGGQGHQVRDCLHARDLTSLLLDQIDHPNRPVPAIVNVAGGIDHSLSLRQLSAWCAGQFGAHAVESDPAERAFDLPWVVLDSALAEKSWQWRPQTPLVDVLEEIGRHARAHPEWLDLAGG